MTDGANWWKRPRERPRKDDSVRYVTVQPEEFRTRGVWGISEPGHANQHSKPGFKVGRCAVQDCSGRARAAAVKATAARSGDRAGAAKPKIVKPKTTVPKLITAPGTTIEMVEMPVQVRAARQTTVEKFDFQELPPELPPTKPQPQPEPEPPQPEPEPEPQPQRQERHVAVMERAMGENKKNRSAKDVYASIWRDFESDRKRGKSFAYINLIGALSHNVGMLVPLFMTAKEHMQLIAEAESNVKNESNNNQEDPREMVASWLRGEKELTRIPFEKVM